MFQRRIVSAEVEQATAAAIEALYAAITAVRCGEFVDASNHIHHAEGWLRDLR